MLNGRKRVAAVAVAVGVTAAPLFVVGPSYADPSVDDVKAKVDALYAQAEQAGEQANNVSGQLDAAQKQLAALQADLAREQAGFEQVRASVAQALVVQYQSQSVSTTGQVLLSGDPETMLQQLQLVSAYNQQQGAALQAFGLEAKRLQLRQLAEQRQIAEIAQTKAKLADAQKDVKARAAAAQRLLGSLTAADQQRVAQPSRSAGRAPDLASMDASAAVKTVLGFALSQVGKRYSYGATGPSAYDCSGLTMVSFAQAGISLPHSSSGQRGYGTPVAKGDLQPGDLVFYYKPISHVAIYIGDGQIVHAARPGEGVRISPVDYMPYNSAVRVIH